MVDGRHRIGERNRKGRGSRPKTFEESLFLERKRTVEIGKKEKLGLEWDGNDPYPQRQSRVVGTGGSPVLGPIVSNTGGTTCRDSVSMWKGKRSIEVNKTKRGTETRGSSEQLEREGGAHGDEEAHSEEPIPQTWTWRKNTATGDAADDGGEGTPRQTQGTIGIPTHARSFHSNTAMMSIRMLTKNRAEDVRSAGPCSSFPVLKLTPPTGALGARP